MYNFTDIPAYSAPDTTKKPVKYACSAALSFNISKISPRAASAA